MREENSHDFIGGKRHHHTEDVNGRLILDLRELGHKIRFLLEGKGSQKRILTILKETGRITQRELTERIGIQPGSASEVVLKLEGAGLIQRTPSLQDRRTADILLTPSGISAAEDAEEQRERLHGDMFSCLSEEEKASLLALLDKLNLDWEQRYGREEHRARCAQNNPHRRRNAMDE